MQLSKDILENIIKTYPGEFALYEITEGKLNTLFFAEKLPDFCGFSKAEYETIIKEDAAAIVLSEDRSKVRNVLGKLLNTKQDIDFTYRILHKNGFIWVHAKARYLGELDNNPIVFAAFFNTSEETAKYLSMLEKKYNNLFRQMAKAYPSSLGTFRLNLSQNLCLEGESAYVNLLTGNKPCTVDSFFGANEALLANDTWKKYYHSHVSKEQLLALFKRGKTEFSIDYPVRTHTGDIIWIHGFVKMAQNPFTTDVEAITYALDFTDKKVEEDIVTRLTEENYDYIALINIHKQTFTLYKKAWPFIVGELKQQQDYAAVMQEIVAASVIAADADAFLTHTALQHLVTSMQGDCKYNFTFYCKGTEGKKLYRKKLLYNWLDDMKNQIICAQTDVTAIFEQEKQMLEERLKLAQSEERLTNLETIVSNFPEGLAVYKKKKNAISILMANQYLSDLVGVSRKVIMAKPFDDQVMWGVHPADLQIALQGVQDLFTQKFANFLYRTRYKETDKYIWLNALGKAVEEPDGSTVAYVVYRDATEQKQREAEFNRKIKEVSSLNPNTIAFFHLNLTQNTIIECSMHIHDVYGITKAKTADELIEACLHGMHTKGDQERMREIGTLQAMLEAYKQGKTSFTGSYRILETGSGLVLWLTTYYTLAKNPVTGDVEALIATVNTNDAIRGQEIVTRITDEDYDYIATVDLGQKIISYCDAKNEYKSIAPVPGMPYDESVKIITAGLLQDSTQEQSSVVLSLKNILTQLAKKENFVYAFSIKDTQGAVHRKQVKYTWMDYYHDALIMARTDVTAAFLQEQKQMAKLEQALRLAESANNAKTDFMSRISHDIRTPLSIISNMTEFAFEDMEDKAKLCNDLMKIATSNKFLLSLINDVLDISKIDSGKIELRPEPYLFEEYILNIRNILEPLCAQKGLKYIIEDCHKTAGVLVDGIRLNQVTINLISNAVKYTPAGGSITFFVADVPRGDGTTAICIKVRDTGMGMSQEFQKVMFEPFTQEYSESRRHIAQSGSGLGLSIVQRLVGLMGGTITVQSTPGKGTTMEINLTLPQTEQEGKTPVLADGKKTAATARKQLQGRVLLVEDNLINTEIAVRVLRKFGLAVDKAANGQEGWQKFAAAKPGTYKAILMDIQMPVMSGYDATAKIRALEWQEAKDIPIIAMTADAFAEALERAKAVGMNDYVTKPLQLQVLYNVLAKYL